MKYLFLSIIVIILSVKVDAQKTWLHISYSWAKDDARLFAIPTRLSAPIRLHENYDDDNGTDIYSIGFRINKRHKLNNLWSFNFVYGLDISREIQSYSKQFSSIYFNKIGLSDVILSIPDMIYDKYYIHQLIIPHEFRMTYNSKYFRPYIGLKINFAISIEKRIEGTILLRPRKDALFIRRKVEFRNASINPTLGLLWKRIDIGFSWRWKQISAFDRAIYSTGNYAASNSRAQHEFSAIKYEWFNPFKIGMSLRYRL